MNGTIFNIQHFSIHDGPGLRTTVFFKGCNLRCLWCHNPESISKEIQLQYAEDLCIFCGNCLRECNFHAVEAADNKIRLDHVRCTACMKCTDTCYSNALTAIGKEVSSADLFQELKNNIPYYQNCRSGGGVTFSGGECMIQPNLLAELLLLCKEESIHTAVDTAGNVPYDYFDKINPHTDLYLYDIKAYSDELHQRLTGVSNIRILKNLEQLLMDGKNILVRIPVIPEANGGDLNNVADYLKDLGILEAELLAYHNLGKSKEARLGKLKTSTTFTEPSKQEMEDYKKQFAKKGIEVKI